MTLKDRTKRKTDLIPCKHSGPKSRKFERPSCGSRKAESEIRLESVQGSLALYKNRLETVQSMAKQFFEIRPEIVQFPEGVLADGQVSREFLDDLEKYEMTQSLGGNLPFGPLNLGVSEEKDEILYREESTGRGKNAAKKPGALHETESEFRQ